MTRKCNECSAEIPHASRSTTTYHKAKFCGWDCMTAYGLAKAKKNAQKREKIAFDKKKAEFKEMKQRVKDSKETIGVLKQRLQPYINFLAKIVNNRPDCISCGHVFEDGEQIDGGHFIAVGQCDALRFNIMNIFPQCTHCNNYLKGNQIEYELRLRKIKGDDYVDYLLEQKRIAGLIQGDRLWDKVTLRNLIRHTRKNIRLLTKK